MLGMMLRFALAAAVLLRSGPGFAQQDVRRVTLRAALIEALRANPDIQTARLARQEALARGRSAGGQFAPGYFLETTLGSSTLPTSFPTLDADGSYLESTLGVSTGVSGELPPGTRYGLTVSATRTLNDAADEAGPTYVLRPAYDLLAQAELTQPILRGAWGVRTEGIRTAELDAQAAAAREAAIVADLALAVVTAYWRLLAAQEAERIAGESVDLARDQERATKLRIDAGRLSQLDEMAARATVAARQDQLVVGRRVTLEAEAMLLALLSPAGASAADLGLRLQAVRNVEAPPSASGQPDLESELRLAMRTRPELRELRLRLRSARTHAEALRHETLPDLSITGTVGVRGLAGAVDPSCAACPEYFDGGLAQSAENTPRFPFVSIRARLELPLGDETRFGAAQEAALGARARAEELRRAEWSVRTQVRLAVWSLDQAAERLGTAGAALALAEQSLGAERRKFEAGVSTTFEVIRVQESLAVARNAHFGAIASHRIAAAQLAHRRGTLLTDLGLTGGSRPTASSSRAQDPGRRSTR